jgi:hypothetical protein
MLFSPVSGVEGIDGGGYLRPAAMPHSGQRHVDDAVVLGVLGGLCDPGNTGRQGELRHGRRAAGQRLDRDTREADQAPRVAGIGLSPGGRRAHRASRSRVGLRRGAGLDRAEGLTARHGLGVVAQVVHGHLQRRRASVGERLSAAVLFDGRPDLRTAGAALSFDAVALVAPGRADLGGVFERRELVAVLLGQFGFARG